MSEEQMNYRWWLCVVVLMAVTCSFAWFVMQPASPLRAGVALVSLAVYVVVRLWAIRGSS